LKDSRELQENNDRLHEHEARVERDSPTEWFCSFPAFLIFGFTVMLGLAEYFHSTAVHLGMSIWPEYHQLRLSWPAPSCNPDINIEQELSLLINREIDDEFDLFDDPLDTTALRQAVINRKQRCIMEHIEYHRLSSLRTAPLNAYRTLETGLSAAITIALPYKKYLLAVLVLLCATAATLFRHHISLRLVRNKKDYVISTGAQLCANLLLLFTSIKYLQGQIQSMESGVQIESLVINYIWISGFSLLSIISLAQLFSHPSHLLAGGSNIAAIFSIPLYTLMCLTASTQFFLDGHYTGISIYLSQMMELATLFLNLGLYIWIGMLLKQTQFVHRCIELVRVWKLAPEMLAVVLLVVTAVPTAYTGASGIFVIAAGAIIFRELQQAGARRQFSLAVTAMSGSMGVVFRPCLMVVIIAALNNEVTTNELYDWGLVVFGVTIAIFAFIAYLTREHPIHLPPLNEALRNSAKKFKPLLPYVITTAVIVLLFQLALDTKLNEFSAPIILPCILLLLLFYERLSKRDLHQVSELVAGIEEGVRATVRKATNEATLHVGALLMLMALSVSLGGMIERSHVMDLLPEQLASPWATMAVLTTAMIIIGMIMDPYGAIILVSAGVAPLAYQAGINPIHFWMVALVAFELGYLSPPVALNHLLTRQVVGEHAVSQEDCRRGSVWFRYERFLLPIAVLGTALLLVTFVPLLMR
jgi:TRAP-type C4-dicarboxylate transport system permease large subunit